MEVDNSVTASGDDKEGNPFKKKKNCDRRGKGSFYNLLSSKKRWTVFNPNAKIFSNFMNLIN